MLESNDKIYIGNYELSLINKKFHRNKTENSLKKRNVFEYN